MSMRGTLIFMRIRRAVSELLAVSTKKEPTTACSTEMRVASEKLYASCSSSGKGVSETDARMQEILPKSETR